MKHLILTLSFILLSSLISDARLIESQSHQELTKKSDLIAILKPLKTVKADYPFKGDRRGYELKDFQAWKTTFEILTVFKGANEVGKTIDLIHFTYVDGLISMNGALFASFPLKESQRKVIITARGADSASEHFHYLPIWLSYLKKEKENTYRPVVEDYDSSLSFFEMPTPR